MKSIQKFQKDVFHFNQRKKVSKLKIGIRSPLEVSDRIKILRATQRAPIIFEEFDAAVVAHVDWIITLYPKKSGPVEWKMDWQIGRQIVERAAVLCLRYLPIFSLLIWMNFDKKLSERTKKILVPKIISVKFCVSRRCRRHSRRSIVDSGRHSAAADEF